MPSRHINAFLKLTPIAQGMALALISMAAAHAQTAPPADAPVAQKMEAVVITGSKIATLTLDSASPIVITSKVTFEESGNVAVEKTLNNLPQFQPAGTESTGGQGTGARATLNLRGLGDNRNLVLLDGKRLPMASSFGQVDINIIPPSIIDGVEVISGGASAVYGSDAMSGVVNFKSIKKFEGLTLDVQYGNTEKSDHATSGASIVAGGKFADGRGHNVLSIGTDYRSRLEGMKRPFFALGVPSGFIGTSTYVPSASNLPTQAAIDSVFAKYGVTSTVPRTNNLGFNDNGTLFSQTGATNYLGPVSNGYAIVAGNVRMPVLPQGDLVNAMRRENIFDKLEFSLTPDLTAYAQLLHTHQNVNTNSGGSLTQFGLGGATMVPVTNPFVPADLKAILATRGNATAPFLWNTRFVGVPAKNWDESYNTDQLIVGMRGNLPYKDWTWDAYVSSDRSAHEQTMNNAVLSSRVQELLSAADGGKSICAGGFNPFGIANSLSMSAACRSYLTTSAISTETLTQRIAEASLQGTLFNLPAGEVQFSTSVNTRKNTYLYIPDSQLAAQNLEAVIASQRSSGATDVKEVALELRVPLLRDLPMVKSLTVTPGYRHSEYNTGISTGTYKVETEWMPVKNWLVRGGIQHASRAPNIGELFSAATGAQVQFGSPPSGGEPCDSRTSARTGVNAAALRALCIATGVPANVVDSYTFPTVATSTLSSGNLNLKPEVADTKTLGLAFTPKFSNPLFADVSGSIDFYDINIKDTISPVPAASALNKCYNLDGSNPTYSTSSPFCALISRDANGLLTQVAAPYLNLGTLKTSGVDLQLDWRFKLSAMGLSEGSGSFGVTTVMSYLRNYVSQALPGDAAQDFKGTIGTVIIPTWQSDTTFRYTVGAVTTSLHWHHLPAMKDVTAVTRPASPAAGVEKYDKFDLSLRYGYSKNLELRAGITNLLNRDPALVPGNQNLTLTSVYDILGRSYNVGARYKF